MTKSSKKIVRATALPEHTWKEYYVSFVRIPNVILDAKKEQISRIEKLVIISLLHRLENRKKPAAVSVRSIARDWGMRPHTVQQQMEWFEIAGWLVRTEDRTQEGAVKYILNLERFAAWLGERGVFPREQVLLPPGTGVLPGGTGVLPPGSTPIPSQIPERGKPFPDPAPPREGVSSSQGPGTGNVRYPKKIGRKYKNGRDGAFCTIQGCGKELSKGEGWYIVSEEGAITYCPEHIHAAEVRFKLTSIGQRLPRGFGV